MRNCFIGVEIFLHSGLFFTCRGLVTIFDNLFCNTCFRCLVVNNFRSKDVALHGEGAPLVPMGEACLFSQYDLCLNLGGIANVSIRDRSEAYDVCVCNMALNFLVQRLNTGLDFDEDGAIAKSGNVLESVLGDLNSLDYFKERPPKSLGREWFEENMKPILDFKVTLIGITGINCLWHYEQFGNDGYFWIGKYY